MRRATGAAPSTTKVRNFATFARVGTRSLNAAELRAPLEFFETIPLLNDNARFRRLTFYRGDLTPGGNDLTPLALIAA